MNRILKTMCGLGLGLVLAAGWSSPAWAALLAYEPFNYGLGAFTTGANGGTGWGGAWTVSSALSVSVVNETLSYSGGSVSVNGGGKALLIQALQAWTGAAEIIRRKVSTSAITEPVYMSLLLRWVNAGTSSAEFSAALFDNNEAGDGRSAGFGITDVQSSNTVPKADAFFARVGGYGDDPAQVSAGTPVSGTTYFLVAKLFEDSGEQKVALWVNPKSLDENNPAALVTLTASKASFDVAFTYFGTKFARFEQGDQVYLDEIRIGTTYGDVVPEPTSVIALGGLGLIAGFSGLRRLRRRAAA